MRFPFPVWCVVRSTISLFAFITYLNFMFILPIKQNPLTSGIKKVNCTSHGALRKMIYLFEVCEFLCQNA